MSDELLIKKKARAVMLEDLGFELLAMEVTLKLINAKILVHQRSRERLVSQPGSRPPETSAGRRAGGELLGLLRGELRELESHRLGLEQNIEAVTEIRGYYEALTFVEGGGA